MKTVENISVQMTVIQNKSNTIGELSYNVIDQNISFTLAYRVAKATKASCIILDEKGREQWEGSFELLPSVNKLSFQTPLLLAGRYNCWIELNGKTQLRSIQINRSKKHQFLNKLKALF